jgi:hypothetical protein
LRPYCVNLKRLEISTADRWMRWPHGSHCGRALVAQTATVVQTGSLKKYVKEVRHELVMLPYYGVFDNLYKVDGAKVTMFGEVTRR